MAAEKSRRAKKLVFIILYTLEGSFSIAYYGNVNEQQNISYMLCGAVS